MYWRSFSNKHCVAGFAVHAYRGTQIQLRHHLQDRPNREVARPAFQQHTIQPLPHSLGTRFGRWRDVIIRLCVRRSRAGRGHLVCLVCRFSRGSRNRWFGVNEFCRWFSRLAEGVKGDIQGYRAEPPDAVDRAGILSLRGVKSLQPTRQLIRAFGGGGLILWDRQ